MVDRGSQERKVAGYVWVPQSHANVRESVDAYKGVIQAFARVRGSETVVWYVEEGDGTTHPVLDALLAHAHAPDREFDAVLVWSSDSLGCSWKDDLEVRSELLESGVTVESVRESHMSTPAGQLTFAIISLMDHLDRERHRLLTRRGIEAARQRREED